LVLASVAAIAANGAVSATSVPDSGDAATPTRGGRLVLAVGDEATLGLEPWTAVTDYGGATVATTIYDTLAAFNAEGEAVPYLAESIEPNEDATVWTVKLRDGIKFHDGTDLTSEAITWAFDHATAEGRILEDGFTVEAVDPLTAVFTFVEPYVAFPASMASQWAWVVSPTASQELGDDFRNQPVGTGPYMFEEWVRDDHITLVRNPDYWRDDVAFVDEVEFRTIPDDAARRAALLAGDVDGIMVGPADIASLREESAINLHETVGGVSAVCFNMGNETLADLRVRQALSMAIDVPAVIDTVYAGVGEPASGPLPHNNPFFHEVDYPAYDPDAARQLLEEYQEETGNSVSFEYLFGNAPIDQELAQLLQAYWQDVGAEVTLGAPLNTGDLQTRRVEHGFDVVSCGMDAVFDPDVWFTLFRSGEYLDYSNNNDPEIDQAINDSRSSLAFEDRAAAYARLQERLAETLPWFFISEGVLAVATQPYVHGIGEWTLPDGSPGTSKQFWLPFTVDSMWLEGGGD
jgi:ABC-type transport system substrate-binding protein